mgnify:FL=1
MKEQLLKLGEWIQHQLEIYAVWLFWGSVGSAVATLLPRNKKTKTVIPLWVYIVKFLAGLLFTLAAGDWVSTKWGIPASLAGWLVGLTGYGIIGFFIRSSENPVKLYKQIKQFKEEEEDKDDDDTE